VKSGATRRGDAAKRAEPSAKSGHVGVREFRKDDGAAVRAFWETSGIRFIAEGEPPATPLAAFAERNPGLFLLAQDERGLAATALGGWDGRRGWLYHVAVRPDQRRRGLGARLVRMIEQRLRERGCPKVNLIVWDDNAAATLFWAAIGYQRAATVEFEKVL
jgi:ribosomal protein S18 acetylase RimI-like enzyme